jgi:hypothetical protein
MSDLDEEAQAAIRKVQEEFAAAEVQEQAFAAKIKPHLVLIAFIIGALLGFIAGKVHL